MKINVLNRVENILSNGEIDCFEQFLLFSQRFQKSFAADASETVYIRDRVNDFLSAPSRLCRLQCKMLE